MLVGFMKLDVPVLEMGAPERPPPRSGRTPGERSNHGPSRSGRQLPPGGGVIAPVNITDVAEAPNDRCRALKVCSRGVSEWAS